MLAFLQDTSAGCIVVLRPPEEGERKDRDGEEDGPIPPKTSLYFSFVFPLSLLSLVRPFSSAVMGGMR